MWLANSNILIRAALAPDHPLQQWLQENPKSVVLQSVSMLREKFLMKSATSQREMIMVSYQNRSLLLRLVSKAFQP